MTLLALDQVHLLSRAVALLCGGDVAQADEKIVEGSLACRREPTRGRLAVGGRLLLWDWLAGCQVYERTAVVVVGAYRLKAARRRIVSAAANRCTHHQDNFPHPSTVS